MTMIKTISRNVAKKILTLPGTNSLLFHRITGQLTAAQKQQKLLNAMICTPCPPNQTLTQMNHTPTETFPSLHHVY